MFLGVEVLHVVKGKKCGLVNKEDGADSVCCMVVMYSIRFAGAVRWFVVGGRSAGWFTRADRADHFDQKVRSKWTGCHTGSSGRVCVWGVKLYTGAVCPDDKQLRVRFIRGVWLSRGGKTVTHYVSAGRLSFSDW